MSILIRSSLDSSEYVSLPNLIDVFNPTKHRYWDNEIIANHVTAGQWRSIMQCFWTRENISNMNEFYRPVVFDSLHITPSTELATIISETVRLLPDDALWFLNFCKITRHGENYRLETINWSNYSRGNQFSFGWDIITSNHSNATDLAAKILETANHFNTFVNQNQDKRCYDWLKSVFHCANLFFTMCTGGEYAKSNRERYNAENLHRELLVNTEATLSFNRNFSSLTVTIPITYANRNQLYSIFPYSTDITTIIPGKKKLPTEGTPIHVGVELEVSTDYDVARLIDASTELFFIAKQDSSITGKKLNHMELVTVPASFKYLKKQYAHWFNNLDYRNFDCTTETNNGMHVHVDRQAFDDDYHIRNFCWFINNPANTPFIVAMSDRGSLEAMRNYTPFLQFPSHSTRTTAFKSCHRLLDGHRGATNLKNGWANAKTVEVRIFRGIVSYAAIVKNLEFVESLFHFTKSLSSYRELSLACYIKWLFNTPVNRFLILKKFVQSHDLGRFLLVADIKDIIFNETDPEKIAKALMASKLPITSDHITYLNRGRKRTFTLNKDTGQINVIKTNIFKLADLDIDLAKRISGNVTRAA